MHCYNYYNLFACIVTTTITYVHVLLLSPTTITYVHVLLLSPTTITYVHILLLITNNFCPRISHLLIRYYRYNCCYPCDCISVVIIATTTIIPATIYLLLLSRQPSTLITTSDLLCYYICSVATLAVMLSESLLFKYIVTTPAWLPPFIDILPS